MLIRFSTACLLPFTLLQTTRMVAHRARTALTSLSLGGNARGVEDSRLNRLERPSHASGRVAMSQGTRPASQGCPASEPVFCQTGTAVNVCGNNASSGTMIRCAPVPVHAWQCAFPCATFTGIDACQLLMHAARSRPHRCVEYDVCAMRSAWPQTFHARGGKNVPRKSQMFDTHKVQINDRQQ